MTHGFVNSMIVAIALFHSGSAGIQADLRRYLRRQPSRATRLRLVFKAATLACARQNKPLESPVPATFDQV
jgi:hypothetical protein